MKISSMERDSHSPRFSLGMFAFLILSCAPGANATVARIPTDTEMIVSSRAIVRARILSLTCGLDPSQAIVYTYVRLRVREFLKGAIDSTEIVLKEPGGQAGTRGTIFSGSPEFTAGEEVVLFLDTWPDGSLRVHDMFLGKFTIAKDSQSGQLFVVRDLPGSQVALVSPNGSFPQAVNAGQATSRMELAAYLRMVRRKLADNLEESQEFEDNYYRGAALLPQPPDYGGLTSRMGIQPEFHLKNPPARWVGPDMGQPVTFFVNPVGAPNPQIMDDVSAALNAWSTVPGCSLRLVNGGVTSACDGPTGPTVIDFSNCSGMFPPDSSCSVLSSTGVVFDTTSTSVVNLTSYFRLVRAIVFVNPHASCMLGNRCNLQELLTAAIGLALGPTFSWSPTFGGSATPDEMDATLFFHVH